MKIGDRLKEGCVRNPVAWVLFALLVVAEYGNYTTGRDLERVCSLIGSHDVSVKNPRTARQVIDNICIGHESSAAEN